jgi:hypothetical protein
MSAAGAWLVSGCSCPGRAEGKVVPPPCPSHMLRARGAAVIRAIAMDIFRVKSIRRRGSFRPEPAFLVCLAGAFVLDGRLHSADYGLCESSIRSRRRRYFTVIAPQDLRDLHPSCPCSHGTSLYLLNSTFPGIAPIAGRTTVGRTIKNMIANESSRQAVAGEIIWLAPPPRWRACALALSPGASGKRDRTRARRTRGLAHESNVGRAGDSPAVD